MDYFVGLKNFIFGAFAVGKNRASNELLLQLVQGGSSITCLTCLHFIHLPLEPKPFDFVLLLMKSINKNFFTLKHGVSTLPHPTCASASDPLMPLCAKSSKACLANMADFSIKIRGDSSECRFLRSHGVLSSTELQKIDTDKSRIPFHCWNDFLGAPYHHFT